MKRILITLFFIGLAGGFSAVYSEDGEELGKVGEVNKASGEITVNVPNSGQKIKMGDILYVRIDGAVVKMRAVFPMMTIARCKIEQSDKQNIILIKKGLTVWRYKKGVENIDPESESTVLENTNDSIIGTEWTIKYSNTDGYLSYLLIFKPDGRLENRHPNESTPDNDFWEQDGNSITMKINDSFVIYKGTINGSTMKGSATNTRNHTWEWEAVKVK